MAVLEADQAGREEHILATSSNTHMTMQSTTTDLNETVLLKISTPLPLRLEGIHAAGLLPKCDVLHAKTFTTDAVLHLKIHILKDLNIKTLHIHRIDPAKHDRQCRLLISLVLLPNDLGGDLVPMNMSR
jgi:hypothetical protein